MGSKDSRLCADCLWDQGVDTKAQNQVKKVKVRPLLCDLEHDFNEFADKDGQIRAGDLAEIWERCAERKVGKLSQDDIETIDEHSKLFLDVMDIDHSGTINFSEFAAWMLGDEEEHMLLQQLRGKLADNSKENDLSNLQDIVKMFTQLDKNGDGFITIAELQACLGELSKKLDGDASLHRSEKVMQDVLNQVQRTADGRVDLWDVLANSLGRKKVPVELLLYDISNGISKKFSTVLLGKSFEAIYHSAVLVFGDEYWYGGEVFRTEPPNTELFGPPLDHSCTHLAQSTYYPDLHVVPLGYTLTTLEEFHTFLAKSLMVKYTPEAYDVLSHNCNNFSDDAVNFLTGEHIPDEVRNLPQLVMGTPTARLLRPFLNKWLGGFAGGMHEGDPMAESSDFTPGGGGQGSARESVREPVDAVVGDHVVVNMDIGPAVVAKVVRAGKEEVDVKFYDQASSDFTTLKVPISRIVRKVDSTSAGAASSAPRRPYSDGPPAAKQPLQPSQRRPSLDDSSDFPTPREPRPQRRPSLDHASDSSISLAPRPPRRPFLDDAWGRQVDSDGSQRISSDDDASDNDAVRGAQSRSANGGRQ